MRWGWLVFAALALTERGAAQTPSGRAMLRHFRDSIALVRDVDALLALEQRNILVAKSNRDDPMIKVRLGLIAQRLGDVSGSAVQFDHAIGEFEDAAAMAPDWPMVFHGLGLARISATNATVGALVAIGNMLGNDPVADAASAFAASLRVDSSYVDGLSEIVDLAIRSRNRWFIGVALRAGRDAIPLSSDVEPRILLVRSRIEREAGSVDSAIIAIERAASRGPVTPALLRELAQTRFVAGRLDGAPAWYEGLSVADGDALAGYRRDLVLVLPDSVMLAFDRSPAPERPSVVRRYWLHQEPDQFPADAERVRDHYRRLHVARREFPLPPGFELSDSFPDHVDERGRIFIRHGAPADRAVLSGTIGLPPSESWRYLQPDGPDLIFHFAAVDDRAPFRSVESILDIIGMSNQARWFGGRVDGGGRDTSSSPVNTYGGELTAIIAQQVLLSRWNVSGVYRDILNKGKSGAEVMQTRERAIGVESLASPGGWAFKYELPLGARIDVLAIGSDVRGPTIQVAYAIPGSSIKARPTTRGVAYSIRLRATVRTLEGVLVSSIDTVRVFVAARELRHTEHLLGRLPISVPPGTFVVRVALDSDERGEITPRDTIRLAAPSVGSPELSDLALGSRSVRLPLRAASGDTAWFNPLRSFQASQPMQLYFEVQGLPAGSRYRTDIAVTRRAGSGVLGLGSSAMLSLGFDQTHPGGVDPTYREIDIGRLRPGDYAIDVTVTSPGGERSTRRREFVIIR